MPTKTKRKMVNFPQMSPAQMTNKQLLEAFGKAAKEVCVTVFSPNQPHSVITTAQALQTEIFQRIEQNTWQST